MAWHAMNSKARQVMRCASVSTSYLIRIVGSRACDESTAWSKNLSKYMRFETELARKCARTGSTRILEGLLAAQRVLNAATLPLFAKNTVDVCKLVIFKHCCAGLF